MMSNRLEGKPSLLPKPRRPGSSDRLSTDSRRPSAAGHRSSSADPPRGTFGSRLSREASATKLPVNGRSRSQTGDAKYGAATTTPLRAGHYRTTTTPQRTPSEDRLNRDWKTCLERALAFVTIKDQRPISNVAWQRSECARVGEALAQRESSMALIRPLTITRFVDTVGALLNAITMDAKLNNDNYVTKLPHLSKRVLYPGTVTKSWLRTVNTLHAFPHALALVAYLLDLVTHIESPVDDEWLYASKDDLSCLRRDYLYKCWMRFQNPGHQFEDLNEEYLNNLRCLLGNDEEKIKELEQTIQKYSACLNDEAEAAARAEVARREERRSALGAALKAVKTSRRDTRAASEALRSAARDADQEAKMIDADVDRISAELERVTSELESQVMSREQRARLLDDLDYAVRVHDSKMTLADEIQKMVSSKETDLALWQKKTLDSCGEYRQRLIHLAGLPALNTLAIDENSLMGAECVPLVSRAVDTLREEAARLAAKKNDLVRSRSALARKRCAMMEEARSKISEVASTVEREQKILEGEREREAEEARTWSRYEGDTRGRIEEYELRVRGCAGVRAQREYWEDRDGLWRSKLAELKEYIEEQKIVMQRKLEEGRRRRGELVTDALGLWREKMGV
ncbi:unnamed protein product [Danaus chrysippus]|uniref:(African queen) hypothetical protein n=1 Tax=Danaus chrysippus TaxID=151541 RepID=A0A8J2QSE8_9NEOP|nr:unnamed protein product [Danaus chrysippus]